MSTLYNRKGITLLELILAIGLVTIVTLAIYTVLNTGMHTFNSNLTSSQEQGNLRNAMMRLTKLEHKSSETSPSDTGDSVKMNISGQHEIKVISGVLVDVVGSTTTILANDVKKFTASKTDNIVTVTLTGSNDATLTTQFYEK